VCLFRYRISILSYSYYDYETKEKRKRRGHCRTHRSIDRSIRNDASSRIITQHVIDHIPSDPKQNSWKKEQLKSAEDSRHFQRTTAITHHFLQIQSFFNTGSSTQIIQIAQRNTTLSLFRRSNSLPLSTTVVPFEFNRLSISNLNFIS
jgi:hypothetical protein